MFPHSAWSFEVCFDVNKGKAIPIIQDQLRVIDAESLGIPVFNQAVEHIKIMGEIDRYQLDRSEKIELAPCV